MVKCLSGQCCSKKDKCRTKATFCICYSKIVIKQRTDIDVVTDDTYKIRKNNSEINNILEEFGNKLVDIGAFYFNVFNNEKVSNIYVEHIITEGCGNQMIFEKRESDKQKILLFINNDFPYYSEAVTYGDRNIKIMKNLGNIATKCKTKGVEIYILNVNEKNAIKCPLGQYCSKNGKCETKATFCSKHNDCQSKYDKCNKG
ncbi:hypothetical protein BCR32DRAFT_292817 [Anaeromyces robustus]|uniref:Chitin-binding type-1 domain-containing protein n=1 Tax=Anaeromyces robustus TaxID=1754192 RepID=A0A1Y1X8X3_9FUNG|nr:hypothetical protein BCR32DRAFT_292817 [Anaeromyces robustus]|eukprot:ORX82187.1 hypothetical protein BCR32DRAFT_292817 [Anaeromyces robustus]